MKPSATQSHHHRTHRHGLRAEWLTAWFLRLRGWQIVAQRWRCSAGEIDLIAVRRKTLAFVEVKARPTLEAGLYALQPRQQARISRAASAWLAAHPAYSAHTMRLDLVVVSGLWHIRHVRDAFEATP